MELSAFQFLNTIEDLSETIILMRRHLIYSDREFQSLAQCLHSDDISKRSYVDG